MDEFESESRFSFTEFMKKVLTKIIGQDIIQFCSPQGIMDDDARPEIPEIIKLAVIGRQNNRINNICIYHLSFTFFPYRDSIIFLILKKEYFLIYTFLFFLIYFST